MHRKFLISGICLLILFLSISRSINIVKEKVIEDPDTEINVVPSYNSPDAQLTWSSRDSPTPSEFTSPEIYGDHITITAVSNEFPPVGYAALYLNPYIEHIASLPTKLDDGFNPFSDRIEFLDQHFFWLALSADFGRRYPLVFDFTTSNCDVMAWSETINLSNMYYSNNLLGSSMSTNSNPEISSLVWPSDPSFAVWFAIYNHDTSSGSANMQFYHDMVAISDEMSNTVSYDTYYEFQNIQSSILYCPNIDAALGSYIYIPQTYFCNYFYPQVNILTPTTGANWINGLHNITWTASDRNADDEIWFELSLQYGEPGQFIDLGCGMFDYDPYLEYYYHTIDATGIQQREYIVRIVGHDNDTTILPNWPDLRVTKISSPFIFGDIVMSTVIWPSIYGPADFQFTEGDTDQSIIWNIGSTIPLNYTILLNAIPIRNDIWNSGAIEVPLVNLLAGIYEYRLELNPGPSDIVIVTVLSRNNTNSSTPVDQNPLSFPLLVVNAGSAVIILVLVIQTVRHKDENG